MEYKVLYRKYRPTNFENIVGQEYTINILKNSIKNGHISHAYIFSGPRGTGKTSTAKVFAKSINCSSFSDAGPCEQCENCLNFKNNPDIIEIDAASNNGVDEIRELINNIKLTPTSYKYKVYIIDEVHMLSASAFNALLLTLEEPPKHAVFILATTNIESVPITILSRCQRFDFMKIDDDSLVKRLKFVCKSENIDISDEAINEIVYLADGGLRDALGILDQVSSNSNRIELEDVTKNFGTVSSAKIKELLEMLFKNDIDSIINIIDEFSKSSIEYKNLIKKLLDELHLAAIDVAKGSRNDIELEKIKLLCDDLVDSLNKVNVNIDPYKMLLINILKYTSPNKVDSVEQQNTSEEIITIEEKNKSVDTENSNVDNSDLESFINNRINNCFVNASKDKLKEYKDNWEKFKNDIKSNKKIYNLIIDSQVVAASNDYIILECDLNDSCNLINYQHVDIEKKFNKNIDKSIKLVAITPEEWQSEKKIYISNIKNGVVYEVKDEIELNLKRKSELEELADDIFDSSKIEIK